MKWHKTPTVDLLLIGVLPEYRVKGANAIIFTTSYHGTGVTVSSTP